MRKRGLTLEVLTMTYLSEDFPHLSQVLPGKFASSNFRGRIVPVGNFYNRGSMCPPAEMQPPQGQMVMATPKSLDYHKQIKQRSDMDYERL